MSYSFCVKVDRALPIATLVRRMKVKGLRCFEYEDINKYNVFVQRPLPRTPWKKGQVFHLYREFVSNRGIEVCYEKPQISVRVMTLSSLEDYALARRFLEVLVGESGSTIETEEGEIIAPAQLKKAFGDAWARGQNRAGVGAIFHTLKQDQSEHFSMFGTRREFIIGRRLLKELKRRSEDAIAAALIKRMTRVQYVGAEYFPASVMTLKKEKGKTFTACVWGPDVSYFFPEADYLLLQRLDDGLVFVPHGRMKDIADSACTLLDEKQGLVRAISKRNWPALLRRASRFEVWPMGKK